MKKMPAGYGCCASGNPCEVHTGQIPPRNGQIPREVAPVASSNASAIEEFHNIQMFHRNPPARGSKPCARQGIPATDQPDPGEKI
ncbi:MAG: hypothetical protein CM1200mP20_02960 [Pseudomonadota bacterium]|nr:MAG: hypothetical protein CM1200mP20_02960 [Pseudomonadota bacterium]